MENPVELSLRDRLVRGSWHLHVFLVNHHFHGIWNLCEQLVEELIEYVLDDLFRPLDKDDAEEHEIAFLHVDEL